MNCSIFLSYRRSDTAGYAHFIHRSLRERLSTDHRVFIDVDSIEPGLDFVEAIEQAVASCSICLVLMGPHWLANGRLEHPHDPVRLEIATALRHGLRIIPLLVDGTPMPNPDEIPEPLRPLTRRQALEIRGTNIDNDTSRLADVVARITANQSNKPASRPPDPVAQSPRPAVPAAAAAGPPGLTQDQRAFYENVLVQEKKRIQHIDEQIEDELARVKHRLADLQSAKRAVVAIQGGAQMRLALKFQPRLGIAPELALKRQLSRYEMFYKHASEWLREELIRIDREMDNQLIAEKALRKRDADPLLNVVAKRIRELQDAREATVSAHEAACLRLGIL